MSYPHREVSIVVTLDSTVLPVVLDTWTLAAIQCLEKIGTVRLVETTRDYLKPIAAPDSTKPGVGGDR
jgi:hypothetical protein